ncbi:zinc finger protein 883-like [Toxorhynchites rutilus septentrionalis]|uniref:zinc finger protein 883-like n=1 Tax=Toxorhynchites rutilus septentrionalis TaxID=329112 RepID=UPI0024794F75|nr:zinc finger protein 883-like [Toxorhynchites rutilus septentrionalis]
MFNMDSCRLCAEALTASTSVFSHRHDHTLADMVYFVSSVKISETDQLPKQVCPDCVELTIDAFQFAKRVRKMDLLLKSSLIDAEDEMQVACSAESVVYVNQNDQSAAQTENFDTHVETQNMGTENVCLVEEHSSQVEEMNDEIVENCQPSDGHLLDPDEVSVEYLDDEPESESKQLIKLLIESVNDSGTCKWLKIREDLDYKELLGDDFDETDELGQHDSSDEECLQQMETKPENYTAEIDDEQVVRCCSRKCKLVFKTRDELIEHGSKIHAAESSHVNTAGPYECVVCYQRFETRRYLLCHLRRLIRDYRCEICNMYFDAPRDKKFHMKKSHPNDCRTVKVYRLEDQPVKICCGCEEKFQTLEELYQHGVDQHQHQHTFVHNGREIQCNICYKYFKSKASLRNHQVLVYKPKTHACTICDKAFECSSKLSNHLKTHRKDRKFACSTCGGTFKTAADLKGHERVHQEKSHICNVCGSRFNKQSHLRSHLKTHDDNAYEFSCDECPRKFKEKSNLKSHMLVHTKKKPYKCEFCPKLFRYTTDRKRHEMVHTGNYPFGCTVCEKAFARNSQLQAHRRVCDKREK